MNTLSTVVVIGGSGFIGSHLCELLLNMECRVYCVDNFATSGAHNVAHIADRPGFTLIEHDINEVLDLPGRVELVVNLASLPSPVDYLARPVETLRVGSLGALNALDFARVKGARCVYASSSEVYGDPSVHPQTESYHGNVNPMGPRCSYDESKRFGEAACEAYRNVYDVDTVVLRIFNTYGRRMRAQDGRLVPTFIQQALADRPITVHGTGRQTRSLCHVDDTVNALLKAAMARHPGPLNIGNPDELTVVAIAELIRELCGSRSPIQHLEARHEDPARRRPDISLARRALGWEPRVNLRTGLVETIAWFADNSSMATTNL
ncbi:NAD-dependent epimerase/dehydratase family protein [Spirillospora sp. CA-128828]|uniref:NAD-dependent epimerase/dehydratase family protein n=1 Tax=Spirillospora sp. CA-128828 TaxID=3240033 RepID=UPI003D94372B